MTQQDQTQSADRPWLKRLMIGGDLPTARRRMRLGYIAGFAAAAIDLSFWAMESGRGQWEGGFLTSAFVLVEAVLLAALSWGVVKRQRMAATALFWYFLASKPLAFALGWLHVDPRVLAQVFLGYLLFQGMRGAYTYHHLTHPVYPGASAPPQTNR